MDESPLRLLLVDPLDGLVHAWRDAFGWAESHVSIHLGGFQEVIGEFDALLSPGNSYGQMDGGVDGVISRHFPSVQRTVWDTIAERHHGFLPVGSADVIPTGDQQCRWLIYAPTMRLPMRLDGGRDVAIHDALWAALLAVDRHNAQVAAADQIRIVACPGLGTGVGMVRPERAAALMAAAYQLWIAGPNVPISRRESLLGNNATGHIP